MNETSFVRAESGQGKHHASDCTTRACTYLTIIYWFSILRLRLVHSRKCIVIIIQSSIIHMVWYSTYFHMCNISVFYVDGISSAYVYVYAELLSAEAMCDMIAITRRGVIFQLIYARAFVVCGRQ